jgi:nucleotide-binding universal stress UspA family protein
MFKRVLLCYDGSNEGRRALKQGAELALLCHADVHVLVIAPATLALASCALSTASRSAADFESAYFRTLDESIEWLKARGIAATGSVTSGDTIEAIANHAKSLKIDLVVLGHYPTASGGRWWVGSQRAALAERTPCSILIAVDVHSPP